MCVIGAGADLFWVTSALKIALFLKYLHEPSHDLCQRIGKVEAWLFEGSSWGQAGNIPNGADPMLFLRMLHLNMFKFLRNEMHDCPILDLLH